MKTKVLKDGNIKVWWDWEEEYTIVGKNEPLYDSLIDAKVAVTDYSKRLVQEIKDAGLDEIHGKSIEIYNLLEDRLDKLSKYELDTIIKEFNSIFDTKYQYNVNDNGLISIIFGKFDTYGDFKKNYFGTFLLNLYAFKVNISLSEAKDNTLKGLSDLIARFVPGYFKTYDQTCKKLGFTQVVKC